MDQQTEQWLARAAALRRAGRTAEAIAAYSALLEREPDLPDSWYNLAWLQRQARNYQAALECYQHALNRGVRDPEEVHVNRAVILSDHLARHDEAEAELEAALSLNPAYLPALLNLGNLHEDRGRRDAAQAMYRRALEIAPENALATSRLAGVVDTQSQAAGELIEQLQRAIGRARSPAETADLGFGLGRLLDGRGDYRKAFAAYRRANQASREALGASFGGYDPIAQEQFVDRMIAAFPSSIDRSGHTGSAPVFIVGMFRSGSTLVEQILGSHGAVAPAGELDLIPALARAIPGYPQSVAAADDATIEEWRRFYLDGSSPFRRSDVLVTDKRPDNFLHLGLIKSVFPDAKIVHTRRNRLDNLLSLYFLHLDSAMPYALDLRDAAHWHAQYERLMIHWKTVYPNDIVDVDYDELVSNPRPVVEQLLAFLGLRWEDSLLDFHTRDVAVKTASVWQVREPLHARSSGRWRNYSDELKRALGELGQV